MDNWKDLSSLLSKFTPATYQPFPPLRMIGQALRLSLPLPPSLLGRGASPSRPLSPRELHPPRKVAPGAALSHPDSRHRLSIPTVRTPPPKTSPTAPLTSSSLPSLRPNPPTLSPHPPKRIPSPTMVCYKSLRPHLPFQKSPCSSRQTPSTSHSTTAPTGEDHSDHWANIIAYTQYASDSSKSPPSPKRPCTEYTPHPAPTQPCTTTELDTQPPHFTQLNETPIPETQMTKMTATLLFTTLPSPCPRPQPHSPPDCEDSPLFTIIRPAAAAPSSSA